MLGQKGSASSESQRTKKTTKSPPGKSQEKETEPVHQSDSPSLETANLQDQTDILNKLEKLSERKLTDFWALFVFFGCFILVITFGFIVYLSHINHVQPYALKKYREDCTVLCSILHEKQSNLRYKMKQSEHFQALNRSGNCYNECKFESNMCVIYIMVTLIIMFGFLSFLILGVTVQMKNWSSQYYNVLIILALYTLICVCNMAVAEITFFNKIKPVSFVWSVGILASFSYLILSSIFIYHYVFDFTSISILIYSLTCLLIMCISALLFLKGCKNMGETFEILRFLRCALYDMPCLFVINSLLIILMASTFYCIYSSILWLESSGTLVVRGKLYYYEQPLWFQIGRIFVLLYMVWFIFFIFGVHVSIISGTITHWCIIWPNNRCKYSYFYIFNSARLCMMYHLGTVTIASFVHAYTSLPFSLYQLLHLSFRIKDKVGLRNAIFHTMGNGPLIITMKHGLPYFEALKYYEVIMSNEKVNIKQMQAAVLPVFFHCQSLLSAICILISLCFFEDSVSSFIYLFSPLTFVMIVALVMGYAVFYSYRIYIITVIVWLSEIHKFRKSQALSTLEKN